MTYTFEPHKWGNRKAISWAVCEHCGLLLLNNKFTQWAVKNGCNSNDHPEYNKARDKYTKRI